MHFRYLVFAMGCVYNKCWWSCNTSILATWQWDTKTPITPFLQMRNWDPRPNEKHSLEFVFFKCGRFPPQDLLTQLWEFKNPVTVFTVGSSFLMSCSISFGLFCLLIYKYGKQRGTRGRFWHSLKCAVWTHCQPVEPVGSSPRCKRMRSDKHKRLSLFRLKNVN